MTEKYDYIIAGSGMAGLSLAFYLNESPLLRERKTLILDREEKRANDHTWSFWEKENSAFEEIVFRRWNGFYFHGTRNFSAFLSLKKYFYKTIRAEDFYRFIRQKLSQNENFRFIEANIKTISDGLVATDKGIFQATDAVFDSISQNNYADKRCQNLWQHFLGWTIEADAPVFEAEKPTLFDFRTEQKNECRFIYILPHSVNKALVEFTVFSGNILKHSEYEFYLRKYLSEILLLKNFRVMETEYGAIPMSDAPHTLFPTAKTLRIGTAGGFVKPSTGYGFQRTQRFLLNITRFLENNAFEKLSAQDIFGNRTKSRWKLFLDRVLLNVLLTKKHPAADVFTALFANNQASAVLKFLDEETSFSEDLKIMQTVPIQAFTRAALAQIISF